MPADVSRPKVDRGSPARTPSRIASAVASSPSCCRLSTAMARLTRNSASSSCSRPGRRRPVAPPRSRIAPSARPRGCWPRWWPRRRRAPRARTTSAESDHHPIQPSAPPATIRRIEISISCLRRFQAYPLSRCVRHLDDPSRPPPDRPPGRHHPAKRPAPSPGRVVSQSTTRSNHRTRGVITGRWRVPVFPSFPAMDSS